MVKKDDKKITSTMFLLGGSALNDLYKTLKTAKFCEFGETVDIRIIDHVLKSYNSSRFRENLLGQSNGKLDKMLELGMHHDAIKGQARFV